MAMSQDLLGSMQPRLELVGRQDFWAHGFLNYRRERERESSIEGIHPKVKVDGTTPYVYIAFYSKTYV